MRLPRTVRDELIALRTSAAERDGTPVMMNAKKIGDLVRAVLECDDAAGTAQCACGVARTIDDLSIIPQAHALGALRICRVCGAAYAPLASSAKTE